jgi:hypothetical protein
MWRFAKSPIWEKEYVAFRGVSCAAKGIALRFVRGRGLVNLSCCVLILNDAMFLSASQLSQSIGHILSIR